MSRRRDRLYLKRGRFYADFRDFEDGRREALIPPGAKRATTDRDVATRLLTKRLEELEERRRAKALGISPEAFEDKRLEDYAREHLQVKAVSKRPATVARDELSIRNFLAWAPDGIRLSEVDVTLLKAYMLHRLKQPGKRKGTTLAPQTVLHELHAISSMYEAAESEGRVDRNPVHRMRKSKPQVGHRDAVWLEPWEAARLLDAARALDAAPHSRAIPFLYPMLATYLLTGGRKTGVAGLEVRDVEFDACRRADDRCGRIQFRPNAWRALKRKQHARSTPLWPQLAEILREYIDRFERRDGLLFPSESGGMLKDIRGSLAKAAEKAELEKHLSFNVFRHTYISTRLQTLDHEKPVAIFTVACEVGTSPKMIEDTYGHLLTRPRRGPVVEFREADVIELGREA